MNVKATLKFGFEKFLANNFLEGKKKDFSLIFFQKWYEVYFGDGNIQLLGWRKSNCNFCNCF